MNEPLETLHLQEGRLYPVPWKRRDFRGKLRPFIFGMAALIAVLSLLLWDNLFMELSKSSRTAIIALVIYALLADVDEWVPSEVDWMFYDDRIEVFRKRVRRGRNFYRQEWQCMYYSDMTRIKRRLNAKSLEIEGRLHGIYKEYDKKTGQLQERVAWDKTVNAALNFYYGFMDIDMVVQKLEKYTPLKVEERMS